MTSDEKCKLLGCAAVGLSVSCGQISLESSNVKHIKLLVKTRSIDPNLGNWFG